MTDGHDIQALAPLLGLWRLELRHPAFPGTTVRGEASFGWLEGERFLIQRSRTDHPDFPDSISILGAGPDGWPLQMDYFDSRGVRRVYGLAVEPGAWRLTGSFPDFHQRFRGEVAEGGDVVTGLWEMSRDGGVTWADDLEIVFRRYQGSPGPR